jgi:hypothetical protein
MFVQAIALPAKAVVRKLLISEVPSNSATMHNPRDGEDFLVFTLAKWPFSNSKISLPFRNARCPDAEANYYMVSHAFFALNPSGKFPGKLRSVPN